MSLIPWRTKHGDEPTASNVPLVGFRTEMDRLFDSFLRDAFSWTNRPGSTVGTWDPPMDIEETDKEVVVRAEIAGVKAEDLNLAILGNALVISGEKKESQEKREQGYYYQERRFGSFRREVPLPSAVDADNVQAEFKDGVLHVKLQKAQEALPRKIVVKAT